MPDESLLAGSATAKDLLRKVLHPDEAARPSIAEMMKEPFFIEKPQGGAGVASLEIQTMLTKLDKMAEVQGKIYQNTVALKRLAAATQDQLKQTQEVLLRAVFEATEVYVPTSCVVLDYKLNGQPIRADRKIQVKQGDGSQDSSWREGACGELDTSAGPKKKRAGFMDRFKSKKLYLYLIDEVTGEPVEEDPYPIEITTKSKEMMAMLLPFMKVGITAMAVLNGLACVARLFFPFVPVGDFVRGCAWREHPDYPGP